MWGLAGLAGVATVAIVAGLIFLNTELGRRFVLAQLEPAIEDALASELEIGSVGGDWPRAFTLRNVSLQDEDGEWLRLGELRLAWRPRALIWRTIYIETLEASELTLDRLPTLPQTENTSAEQSVGLPDLPRIVADRLALTRARLGEAVIPGGAGVSIEAALDLRGNVAEVGAASRIDLGLIETSGQSEWIGQELQVSLASRIGLEDLTLADAFIRITSDAGTVALEDLESAGLPALTGRISAAMAPPPALASRAELTGDQLTLSADLRLESAEAARLDHIVLTGAPERPLLTGAVDARSLSETLDVDAALEMSVDVLNALAPNYTPQTGGRLTASLSGPSDAFAMNAQLDWPQAEFAEANLPPLMARAEFAGLPGAPAGRINLLANEGDAGGREIAHLQFDARDPARIEVSDLDFDYWGAQINGAAVVSGSDVSAQARFSVSELSALPLPILASGDVDGSFELAQTGGRLTLSGRVESEQLSVEGTDIRALRVESEDQEERLGVSLTAEMIAAAGAPVLTDLALLATLAQAGDGLIADLNAFEGDVDGTRATLTAPGRLTLSDTLSSLDGLQMTWGDEGRIAVSGSYGAGQIAAQADLVAIELPESGLRIDLDLDLDTTRHDQPGDLQLRLEAPETASAQTALNLAGGWDGALLNLTGQLETQDDAPEISGADIVSAALPFQLTFTEDGAPRAEFGEADVSLNFEGRAESLMSLAGLDAHVLEGDVALHLTAAGPVETFDISLWSVDGSLTVANGLYENLGAGARMTQLEGAAEISGTPEALEASMRVSAQDGRERASPALTGEGRVTLSAEGGSVQSELSLQDARLIARDDFSGTFDGDMSLGGPLDQLSLSGDLRVRTLEAQIPDAPPVSVVDVNVVPVGGPTEERAEAAQDDDMTLALDLNISADNRIFVRGRGLTSEWSTDMRIQGDSGDPRLSGAVRLVRGDLNFGGRRFELARGDITFSPVRAPDPSLNIRAETETQAGVIARVDIAGRASAPTISLSAVPDQPDEDVMALILFGKPANELSAIESLQAANALASLAAAGPFGGGGGVFERTRRALGVDVLQVDTSNAAQGDVGLTVGKYINDGVYVAASQDASGNNGSVNVQIDLTDNINVQTDVGQDATSSLSLNWKKDY